MVYHLIKIPLWFSLFHCLSNDDVYRVLLLSFLAFLLLIRVLYTKLTSSAVPHVKSSHFLFFLFLYATLSLQQSSTASKIMCH